MTTEQLQQLRDDAIAQYNTAHSLCQHTIVDLDKQQTVLLDYSFTVDNDGRFHFHETFDKDNTITLTYQQVCDLVNIGITFNGDHPILRFDDIPTAQIARALYNAQNRTEE